MLDALLLAVVIAQSPAQPSYSPEELAVGAVREIISAQAYHKQSFPDRGYACSLDRLVDVQALLDTWVKGTRVDGYTFKLWCDARREPQAAYRAAATPVAKAKGARLTVCADETNVPRTIEGTAEACFAKGKLLTGAR